MHTLGRMFGQQLLEADLERKFGKLGEPPGSGLRGTFPDDRGESEGGGAWGTGEVCSTARPLRTE